ncbi:MAG: hypothetical protein JJU29_15225 [Verrucomicrobia bacterium]|nr:hypothetical protein [Verrucomicrobiota bacterium]MCH8513189.1 hypothetical protein [Kiritimatiellia bacterium]
MNPQSGQTQPASPEMAGGPSAPGATSSQPPMGVELPSDHPLRSMEAPPLTVEPVPENLPPNHPTLTMQAPPVGSGGTATPPATGPGAMLGRESEVPPPPAADDLTWDVPEGWRQQAPSGIRLAEFTIVGDDSGALTTLIVFGGPAGSVEANIRRWRGELGLPQEPPSPPVRIGGKMPFVFVDLVDEATEAGRDQATVGAIFDLGDRTAFLKFFGPIEVLRVQRLPFLKLAGSLQLVEDGQ